MSPELVLHERMCMSAQGKERTSVADVVDLRGRRCAGADARGAVHEVVDAVDILHARIAQSRRAGGERLTVFARMSREALLNDRRAYCDRCNKVPPVSHLHHGVT